MSARPRAVVLGTELPRATAVIRSLGAAGVPVVVVDHKARMPGACSRHVKGRVLLEHGPARTRRSADPWPFDEAQALDTLALLGRHGGGVLVPTSDPYLVLVARHHEALSRRFAVAVPPWEVLRPLMAKGPSYRLARKAGLDVPRLHEPADEAELARVAAGLDFARDAWLLRLDVWEGAPTDPESGAFTRPAGGDAGTLVARAREVRGRTGAWPLIQEVVPGDTGHCVGVSLVMDAAGEPRVRYAVRRLGVSLYGAGRGPVHPYTLGANVYAESVRDEEAVEAAVALLRQAGFAGAATVEFRRDARDGRLRFIKVDPRFVNATSLSATLGMDSPLALHRMLAGEPPPPAPGAYPEGVAWIWLERWLRTLVRNRGRAPVAGQLLSVLGRAGRLRAFGYLSRSDPGPWRRAWAMEWNATRFGLRAPRPSRRVPFAAGPPSPRRGIDRPGASC